MATVAERPFKVERQDPVPREQDRARMLARVASMAKAKDSQTAVLRDIQEHIAPYRGRFQTENQDQRGKRKGLKIINGTATRSMNILSSGMMAGLTSPGRPWFKLSTHDPDLAEFTPVRRWLDDVARAMRTTFAQSNLYNILPSVYGELGPFGTTALLEADDPHSIVRFYPFTIGSFSIAQDDRLVVDTFCREYKATVRQLVGRFGTQNLSQSSLTAWKGGKLDTEVACVHLIRPNLGQERKGFGWVRMPFIEEYWEKASDKQEPLLRSGYEERALFVPRWDVTGDDLWGKGIGHDVLGDVKQLQFLERRKEDVLDKHTAPPLEAGAELRGKRVSLLSGDVTYTNPTATGGASIRPIVTTDPNAYRYAAEDIREKETKIRQACYEDLFLMLANDTRSGVTAREVEERHQEKMLVLGPVLERLNEELFDPLIDRTFAIMQRRSLGVWRGMLDGQALLPPPPPDMMNEDIRVEYTSILAQAAKATSTAGLERFGQFVGGMAQMDPSILDKVDFDQFVDEYADAQGVPAKLIRGDDEVEQIRAGRANQQRAQQMAAMAPAAKDLASAMKDAATTVPQEGSIASNLAGGAAGNLLGMPQP
jgi:hypothetical protein